MLRHGVLKAELLDMTPAEIWHLYERSSEVCAMERYEAVEDSAAAVAPTQQKDGFKFMTNHLETLKRTAGLGPTQRTNTPRESE